MKKREKKIYTQKQMDEKSTLYNDFLYKEISLRVEKLKIKFNDIGKVNYFESKLDNLPKNSSNNIFDYFKECTKFLDALDCEFSGLQAEKNKKYSAIERVVLDYDFYNEIVRNMLIKIRESIDIVASPLSGEIFLLKKGCSTFTKSFENWKHEMTDENSKNNYNRVIDTFKIQSENFSNLGSEISNDFFKITNSLKDVTDYFNKISEDTKKIEDIASNIKTLSINASIEAARAGVHGKGFKVIATGTQELSEQTNTLLNSIVNTVKETRDIINDTEQSLIDESRVIIQHIELQKDSYKMFNSVLEEFYSKFQIVFDDIINGTKETFKHIDKVMPMIQLHDGLEQQLGNISESIKKLSENNATSINKVKSEIKSSEINKWKNDLISILEKQITTDIEVEVLRDIIAEYKLLREKNIEIGKNDIEFF